MTTRFQFLPRYLGLALISASILALQVTFTRIFSIMIWYHFTYLVVGVALLGGGAAALIWPCGNGMRRSSQSILVSWQLTLA